MNAIDIVMEELTTQTQSVLDRMKRDSQTARDDVQSYLDSIKEDVGVALDTVIQFPTEETHRNTLVAAANAVWNRTLANVESFSVAQKYELKMGLFAALRVVVQALAGVALVV